MRKLVYAVAALLALAPLAAIAPASAPAEAAVTHPAAAATASSGFEVCDDTVLDEGGAGRAWCWNYEGKNQNIELSLTSGSVYTELRSLAIYVNGHAETAYQWQDTSNNYCLQAEVGAYVQEVACAKPSDSNYEQQFFYFTNSAQIYAQWVSIDLNGDWCAYDNDKTGGLVQTAPCPDPTGGTPGNETFQLSSP
jgi:hypothetical protein